MEDAFTAAAHDAASEPGSWSEHRERFHEETRWKLDRMRVSKELTGDEKLVISGNKMEDGHLGRVYLYVGEPRIDGQPDARTSDGALAGFRSQDALDAAIALANIVEMVAPYAWAEGVREERGRLRPAGDTGVVANAESDAKRHAYPAQALKGMGRDSTGWGNLVREVSAFVDRFGLPHMASAGRSIDDSSWLDHINVRLFDERCHPTVDDFQRSLDAWIKCDIDQLSAKLIEDEMLKTAGIASPGETSIEEWERCTQEEEGDLACSNIPDRIIQKAKEMTIEQWRRHARGSRSVEELYAAELGQLAKHFGGFSNYGALLMRERERLAVIDEKLEPIVCEYRNKMLWDSEELVGERRACIEELRRERDSVHLSFPELVKASQDAVAVLGEKAGALSEHGVWRLNLRAVYDCALLVHDAIEMLLAIRGDEAAFQRILSKVHMERFLLRDGGDPGRYTLWFESVGSDLDNPYPYGGRYVYHADLDGSRVELVRQERSWSPRTFGGSDWMYYRLCERGTGYGDFRELTRQALPYFVEAMIADGKDRRNYKRRFAPGAKVDADNMSYVVNDCDHDLMATIWGALDLVRKGEVDLALIRCEVCGRLVRVRKRRGDAKRRKTCSSACRQRKSRGRVDSEHQELKSAYLEYMESGKEVRVGVDEPRQDPANVRDERGHLDYVASLLFPSSR